MAQRLIHPRHMLSMQAYRRRTMTLKTGSGIGFREVLMMRSEWWEEASASARERAEKAGERRLLQVVRLRNARAHGVAAAELVETNYGDAGKSAE